MTLSAGREELHGLQVFLTLIGLDRCDPDTRRQLDRQLDRFWIAPPEPDMLEPARVVELGVSGAGAAPDLQRTRALGRRAGACVISGDDDRG